MQLSVNRDAGIAAAAKRALVNPPQTASLSDLRHGQSAVIASLDLPPELAHRLMEMGFLPGARVEAARSAPGGDPRVFRVDGTEIALRRETASRVTVAL